MKIVSIKECVNQPKKVYDIDVKDTHNFFADGVLVHNCQEISNSKLRKSISPMLAATLGTFVKIGTAFTKKNDFYDACERNKKRRITEGIRNHFEYDYRVAGKYNPRYAKYVEKEKTRLGEDSDEFRMSYNLEWILERGMAVTPELLEAIGADYDIQAEYRGAPLCAGLDVAKESDSTVLTIIEPDYSSVSHDGFLSKRIVDWLEIYGNDYETQFYQIRDFLNHYSVEKLAVDSTGPGDPIADRMIMNYPDIQIIPFKFSMQSKSDLYKYLLNDISGKRIIYPNSKNAQRLLRHKKFVRQFLDWEKFYNGEYLCCDHPSERDAHDDYPVSLALACWACKEEGIPTMEVSGGFYG